MLAVASLVRVVVTPTSTREAAVGGDVFGPTPRPGWCVQGDRLHGHDPGVAPGLVHALEGGPGRKADISILDRLPAPAWSQRQGEYLVCLRFSQVRSFALLQESEALRRHQNAPAGVYAARARRMNQTSQSSRPAAGATRLAWPSSEGSSTRRRAPFPRSSTGPQGRWLAVPHSVRALRVPVPRKLQHLAAAGVHPVPVGRNPRARRVPTSRHPYPLSRILLRQCMLLSAVNSPSISPQRGSRPHEIKERHEQK